MSTLQTRHPTGSGRLKILGSDLMDRVDSAALDGERDRPGRRQTRFAAGLVILLIIAGVVLTPLASHKLPPVPGYMATFGAAMVVIDLLLAGLLFSRGMIDGKSSAVRLGVAYWFVAVIFVPLMAAFPGAILAEPLIGNGLSAVWLWAFWHAGFGFAVIHYALDQDGAGATSTRVWRSMAICVAVVAVLTLIATVGLPYLPTMLADGHTLFTGAGFFVPPFILLVLAVALAMVLRIPTRSSERLWLAVGLVAALFDVWLTYRGAVRFSVGWYVSKAGSLITSITVLISLMHRVTALHRRVATANQVLVMLAHRDGLTGLANRRRFDELLDLEWRRGLRERRRLSLIMIDVDFFKAFNDRYGHLQGDDCLRQIGALLQSVIRRPADTVARYGGEEFLLLLPTTDAAGASALADMVHAALRRLAIPHEASPLGFVTVSIGIATALPAPGIDRLELLGIADAHLYRAKAAGRGTTSSDDRLCPDIMPAQTGTQSGVSAQAAAPELIEELPGSELPSAV